MREPVDDRDIHDLVIGTQSVYAMSELNDEDDSYANGRLHSASAIIDERGCTGRGTAVGFSFGMVFLRDCTADPSFHSLAESSGNRGDAAAVQELTKNDAAYRPLISECCTVERAEIVTDSINIVMTLVS